MVSDTIRRAPVASAHGPPRGAEGAGGGRGTAGRSAARWAPGGVAVGSCGPLGPPRVEGWQTACEAHRERRRMVDPGELRERAEGVARRGGALLGGALGLVRAEVATKSTLTDMVTEMDRASEAVIVEGLLGARPYDGMLGEEGTDVAGTSGVRWIVDPLDGTTNYLYELPGFNVSIAAELDGAVVAGVVLDVVRNELFAATLGGGATRDGEPISTSDADQLAASLIATGFSYEADRRRSEEHTSELQSLMRNSYAVFRLK